MLDIVIFAALAVFILYKLYEVLGKDDLNEAQRKQSNVVDLNAASDKFGNEISDIAYKVVNDEKELEAEHGKDVAGKIKLIRNLDPSFDDKDFLKGASKAFEMILSSFAKGDKKTLKPLLNREVYNEFSTEIDNREKSEVTHELTLVAIIKAAIKNISLSKSTAKIAVEIVSEQINILRNKEGEIIEGEPSHVDQVAEKWTFSRNLASKNPNWELVATEQAG